jgi:curved DNA-binding protein CbpA
MNDAFALLGQPRHPSLDPSAVRAAFHELANPTHPDRFHGAAADIRDAATERYSALNAAHLTLRETRTRLAHLLELETGAPPRDIQRLPPGVMELFAEIGQTCREVDDFLAKKSAAESPMLKLAAMRDLPKWLGKLNALLAKIQARQTDLDAELAALNPAWDTAPAPGDPARTTALPLDRLEQLYRAVSYASRWTTQVQDRIGQLAT